MNAQVQKRPVYAAGVICVLLMLAAAGLAAELFLSGSRGADPVIARKEEWSVRRGAPATGGKESYVSRAELLRGTLMLASPQHPLPQDFSAPDTRAIRAMVGAYLPARQDTALCREAIYALCSLQADHSLNGEAALETGAVSAAQQEEMRKEAFERYRQVYPLSQALEKSRAAVPGGGESEHQTGWAVDLRLAGPLSLGSADPLLRTKTGAWLKEHLWEYGFIRRYGPESHGEGGCEEIHLRYVGPVHAAMMRVMDMDLEEYLALLRREGSLTLLRDGQPRAYLYCVPCETDLRISLPEGCACRFSADNTGWAVAAAEIVP